MSRFIPTRHFEKDEFSLTFYGKDGTRGYGRGETLNEAIESLKQNMADIIERRNLESEATKMALEKIM